MSKIVRLLSLLAIALLLGSVGSAQPTMRITRETRPLTGLIDRSVYGADAGASGALVDVGQFSSSRLHGNSERNAFGAETAAATGDGVGQMGMARFDVRTPFGLDAQRAPLWGNVTERERYLLGTHDVVVILDRSRSMDTQDCLAAMPGQRPWNPALEPRGSRELRLLSRWQWCGEQAFDLTRQAGGMAGSGITLVLFDRDFDVHEKVSLSQFSRIFATTNPGGGTLIAPPLKNQLSQYFRRRDAGSQRPLAMAIITDGDPHDVRAIRSAIIDATQKMRNQREISITFLLVGSEARAQSLQQTLDDLVADGARYNIVKTRSFSELLQFGLTRCLIEAIR